MAKIYKVPGLRNGKTYTEKGARSAIGHHYAAIKRRAARAASSLGREFYQKELSKFPMEIVEIERTEKPTGRVTLWPVEVAAEEE